MLLEVVFSEASGDNGTTRSRVVHVVVFLIAAWRLSCDHVSDVLDTLIIEVEVTEVWLARVYEDAKQLKDNLVALALSEITHRGLHQIKLLLQVVETDLGVEAVPVQQFILW